jgi:hypothetical protein
MYPDHSASEFVLTDLAAGPDLWYHHRVRSAHAFGSLGRADKDMVLSLSSVLSSIIRQILSSFERHEDFGSHAAPYGLTTWGMPTTRSGSWKREAHVAASAECSQYSEDARLKREQVKLAAGEFVREQQISAGEAMMA